MKHGKTLALIVALALGASNAMAQQKMMEGMKGTDMGGEKDMPMKDMPMKDMPMKDMPMKDMPMKDMPMKDMPMKDMPMKDMPMGASAQGQVHHASGTVKKVDAAKGTVTLAHGPVESLEWPSMTMGFKVKDKALLDKLAPGKQVEFDFVKEGGGYVVTAVR